MDKVHLKKYLLRPDNRENLLLSTELTKKKTKRQQHRQRKTEGFNISLSF